MAVKQGASLPDISTVEKFIETLLAAESFGYSASVSGIYLSMELLPRLGIWEQLEDKGTRISAERVAAVVARGDIEIGFQQISEILPIEGAQLVGPIPSELQKITVYSGAITVNARNPIAAERLLEFLSSEGVAEMISSTGLDPLVRAD